jgi:hypothetical protein
MSRLHHSRRVFLRALGAGAASLPFFKLLEHSAIDAQAATLPLKFIGIYHPHGVSRELWALRPGESETNFDLSYANCSLQPFDDPATYGKSFKSKILVIEGIDQMSNANGHDSAGTLLTGSQVDGKRVKNSSLDQYLAVERGLGSSTRLSSLVLGVGTDNADSGESISFGTGGAPLTKIIDPAQTFDTVFGNVASAADPQAARRQRVNQSMIDFLRADAQRLQGRLAAEERRKLDQHLTSIRELEKQIAQVTPGTACTAPGKPNPSDFPKLRRYNGGEPYFDRITDIQIDLLANALACDATRFATLFLNDLSYAGNPLGLPEDNHGAVAHTYSGSWGPDYDNPQQGNPSTWGPLAKMNRYSYSKVAKLMKRLDDFGILDSTIIYCGSDMGDPAMHSTKNCPTVLAGGANGKFRMGRRIKLSNDCPRNNYWCNDWVRSPNNRLLVSIAQAFGVSINSFGTQADPALTQGTISGLT